ncbi:sensor histidine kinase [Sulfuriroseicoccus oceanibius]|uniref:Histidine kinase n=1 Tax=Sulfuriroseicoccus oceanibius TaxID=2707525 RepID=A0A6B3L8S4_9BACT|nr:ATP-binding protein [Sulfuriroseicoccus oceanibius]QQL45815.1 hypothetical protein G3M56_004320 [Sulfuriroseicoccus oceanibius]
MRTLARTIAALCYALSITHGSTQPEEEARVGDPRSPLEHRPYASDLSPDHLPLYKIPGHIRDLNARITDLRIELDKMQPLRTPQLASSFGYHSSYLPTEEPLPSKPRWVMEFQTPFLNGPLDLVLVPAHDHRNLSEEKSYGFPKRFRIVTGPANKETIIADWTQQDFPDPGLHPVYFHSPSFTSQQPRMEVYRGQQEGDREFFALARAHMIVSNEVRKISAAKASSSFEAKPYWSTDYINHESGVLGLPLGELAECAPDLVLPMDTSVTDAPLIIEIDLGRNTHIGWIDLLPAQSPETIAVPGYGFPGSIKIDIARSLPNGQRGETSTVLKQSLFENPDNNIVHIPGLHAFGRFVRIHCNHFPIHQETAVFSMGEIVVSQQDAPLSNQRPVTLSIGGHQLESAGALLVDGHAQGRQVIDLVDWLQQLATAKQIDAELRTLQTQLEATETRWQNFITWIKGITSAAVAIAVIATIIILALSKRRQNLKLRKQISSDLHDDVGSKVAAISLASTYVKKHATEPRVRERGERIHDIAHDMHQSLRDVLWLTDKDTDTLTELVEKLSYTAQRRIPSETLELQIPSLSQLPKRTISVGTKRDILQFFREALHNASSHANASVIKVEISWVAKSLRITISDNGSGFTPTANDCQPRSVSQHHGLRNMRDRAIRLKASYDVKSAEGQGTTVSLQVPIH